MYACRRSSSSTATGRRACSATTTSSPSAAQRRSRVLDRSGRETVDLGSRTTLFAALVDDLIQWEYAPWGQARAANLARARIFGVEQELRLSFGRWSRLVGQATYLDARDRSANTASNGKQIPYHARYRGYLRPELARVTLPAGLELGAYADAELRMGAYSDPANLEDMQTRVLLGCGVTVTWPRARLRATASAVNLTGTACKTPPDGRCPGGRCSSRVAYAPIGGGEIGSAVFNPRYGQ
jgi:outer membrane receptor protein involved in Fe transport